MGEQMTLRGTLKGHSGWVTQIATTPQRPDMLLSSSRGKSVGETSVTINLEIYSYKKSRLSLTLFSRLISSVF